MYTPHNLFAVSFILGCNLSGVGPGTSAIKSCIPPIPRMGKTTSDNTIIPIPPSHWVILRQKSNPCERDSISFRIEAPVVVKPEMVSKNASVYEGIAPVIIKGIEPKNEKRIQPKLTIIYPSLFPTFFEQLRNTIQRITPVTAVIKADTAISHASVSPYNHEIGAARSIKAPSRIRSTPRINATTLIFTIQD
jgi:hypothetical protein